MTLVKYRPSDKLAAVQKRDEEYYEARAQPRAKSFLIRKFFIDGDNTMLDLRLLIELHFRLPGASRYRRRLVSQSEESVREQLEADYDEMVATWLPTDDGGTPQKTHPSFDDCISAWGEFARAHNNHLRIILTRYRDSLFVHRSELKYFQIVPERDYYWALCLNEDPFAIGGGPKISSLDIPE